MGGGEGGSSGKEYTYIIMTDSCGCMAESNITFKASFLQLKNTLKKSVIFVNLLIPLLNVHWDSMLWHFGRFRDKSNKISKTNT